MIESPQEVSSTTYNYNSPYVSILWQGSSPTYLPTYLTKVPLIAGSINPENVWKRIGLFMPIFGHTDQGALSRGRDR